MKFKDIELNYKIYRILMVAIFLSCHADNVRVYKIPKLKNKHMDSKSNVKQPLDNALKWIKPDNWIESNGSAMRLASFSVPCDEGIGDLSIIKLSGDGGGIYSNINRWRGQLGLKVENKQAIDSSLKVNSGRLGEFKFININSIELDSSFICAIIPLDSSTIFVKLSLPSSDSKSFIENFIEFCKSLYI